MTRGKKEDKVKFEEALAQIEKIVSLLESGNLTLEESLTQFQAGIELIRACHQDLEEAEQKIEMIVTTGEGQAIKEVKITEDGVCL